ncbi:Clp protease N-terminal domain-containing protein [Streptomyces sp. NPDC101213]|uniref:Clp protease N-terminal domain-containing protein n=1 Tax=unclassified Streptomyces TaxID=2593676 RepID=UPI0036F9E1F9
MFERFTKDAREVVRGAVAHCRNTGEGTVGPEHLLHALLDRGASRGSFALAALGLPVEGREPVREALDEARRRAGLSRADADALADLGIDVSEIVSRVEEVHGVGAMAGGRRDTGRRGPGGRVGRPGVGRPGFGREAKGVLEKSLRIALAHRDRHIGDEHLLLALTAGPGPSAEILADHGVTHTSLTRVLYAQGEARAG